MGDIFANSNMTFARHFSNPGVIADPVRQDQITILNLLSWFDGEIIFMGINVGTINNRVDLPVIF